MKDRKPQPGGDVGELGDISLELFREQLRRLADWIADYRENIGQRRISPNDEPGAIIARLDAAAPERAASLDEIFAEVERVIVPGVAHWAHPQFMSYFGCTTTSPGILAEMITGALNVNAMTWRTSPAATELETLVLDWLRQWLGLPNEFSGVVYDTASISTMHALATAREQAAPNTRKLGLSGRNLPAFRIYTSNQAHSSVEKGAIAIGIGEDNVQRVPIDAGFRLDVSALRKMIASDLGKNFKPLAVVATVGTTSTASVDPIPEIVQVCREHKMWLHIDGAYGAGLVLLPECKWVTAGWSEADSIAVGAEINYMDYGVQLGRRFRALKAWVVWRAFGREGLAARIRHHLRLAKLLADWVRDDERFELSAPIVMGVVCFRYKAGDDDEKLDMINSKIVERINASGLAYLTKTKLHGRTVMRIGLGNVLTTEQHLRNVWKLIQNTVGEVVAALMERRALLRP